MNLKARFILLAVFTLGIVAMSDTGKKLDGAYLRDVTTKLETPHLDWAKPLAGGPLKVLLLSPRNLAAREIVELVQRLDLNYEAFVTFCASVFANEDIYDGAVSGTSYAEKEAELLAKLEKKYDVIVLGNCNLSILPPEAKYKLLQQVSNGSGLLIVHSNETPYKKLFAQPIEGAAEILSMAGKLGLLDKAIAVPDDKLLQCFSFGKGRIARIDYQMPHSALWGGVSLTPLAPYNPVWISRYENCLAFVSRAVIWVSGRKREIKFMKPPFEAGKEYDATELSKTTVILNMKGTVGEKGKILLRLRDEWNSIEGTSEIPVSFAKEEASAEYKVGFLKEGIHFLDMRFLSDKGVEDFGYCVINVLSPVGKIELIPIKNSFEKDEDVEVTLKLERPLDMDAKAIAILSDSPYGRLWAKKEFSLKAGDTELRMKLDKVYVPSIAGNLAVEIISEKASLVKTSATIFFPERKFPIFPTISWDCIRGYLSPMLAKSFEGLGWQMALSVQLADARTATIFGQQFVPYISRICLSPYENKPNRTRKWFFSTEDEQKEINALGGDDSIYNPAALKIGKKSFTNKMKGLPELGPAIYSLGDENFFSYDIGYSPSEELEFKKFLKDKYGKVDSLNLEWGSSYPSFDEVEHQKEKEMRESLKFAAWFDHCAFTEKEYADTHRLLSKWIKEIDPRALVGAEGSVPGDLEKTIEGLEFWGPYSDPIMDEVLRSIGGNRIRTLWWGGYTGSHGGRSIYPLPLWRPLLAGIINGSSWFASGVMSEGNISVDFSYPEYFEKLKPRLMKLQNGIAQVLITTPMAKDGVAIRWCHMSSRATLLDERFASPIDSANCIQDFCYRNGINFDYITPSGIRSGKLKEIKILFLCGASVIEDEEADALREFVEDGGILIADLNPGLLNGYGRALTDKTQLSDLFPVEVFSKKVKPELLAISANGSIRGTSLRLDSAKAFSSLEIPTMCIKEYGDGVSCLLNFLLTSAKSTASSETPFETFMMKLFGSAGVIPGAKVESLNPERVMLKIRNAKDGAVIGLLADTKDVGKKFTVKLPKEGYIYRMDDIFLAKSDTISDRLDEPFKLYFIANKEMSEPKIDLSDSSVSAGSSVELDTSDLVSGGVYRIEVVRPDGNICKPYILRENVFSVGTKKEPIILRFALNDPVGIYTLKLTDVRTGLSAKSEITLK